MSFVSWVEGIGDPSTRITATLESSKSFQKILVSFTRSGLTTESETPHPKKSYTLATLIKSLLKQKQCQICRTWFKGLLGGPDDRKCSIVILKSRSYNPEEERRGVGSTFTSSPSWLPLTEDRYVTPIRGQNRTETWFQQFKNQIQVNRCVLVYICGCTRQCPITPIQYERLTCQTAVWRLRTGGQCMQPLQNRLHQLVSLIPVEQEWWETNWQLCFKIALAWSERRRRSLSPLNNGRIRAGTQKNKHIEAMRFNHWRMAWKETFTSCSSGKAWTAARRWGRTCCARSILRLIGAPCVHRVSVWASMLWDLSSPRLPLTCLRKLKTSRQVDGWPC